jgi:hypothetical protein
LAKLSLATSRTRLLTTPAMTTSNTRNRLAMYKKRPRSVLTPRTRMQAAARARQPDAAFG